MQPLRSYITIINDMAMCPIFNMFYRLSIVSNYQISREKVLYNHLEFTPVIYIIQSYELHQSYIYILLLAALIKSRSVYRFSMPVCHVKDLVTELLAFFYLNHKTLPFSLLKTLQYKAMLIINVL